MPLLLGIQCRACGFVQWDLAPSFVLVSSLRLFLVACVLLGLFLSISGLRLFLGALVVGDSVFREKPWNPQQISSMPRQSAAFARAPILLLLSLAGLRFASEFLSQ